MPTAAAPTRRLLDDLRALPRPYWILVAGTFVNRLGTFVWPFLTIYLTRQGYTPAMASMSVACYGVGSLLGSGFGGWLTDHFGRRHVIALGSATAASFVLAMYHATTLPGILLCCVGIGMAGGTYGPASSALLTDLVPEPLRVTAWAAFRLALNAGFAFGAALGGILATHSYRLLFFGDAATTYTYSLIAFLFLPYGLRGGTAEAPWSVAWRYLAQDRVLHRLLLASLGGTLIYAQFGSTYSLQIRQLGLTLPWWGTELPPETVYGLLIGWNGLMVTLFELSLTRWTQQMEPRRAMALGFLLLGLGFGLNGLAGSVFTFWITMTIFTCGEMVHSPVSNAYGSALAPAAMRGRYMGVLEIAHSLGVITGPVLGSLLFERSPGALWAACLLLGAASAGVILRTGK